MNIKIKELQQIWNLIVLILESLQKMDMLNFIKRKITKNRTSIFATQQNKKKESTIKKGLSESFSFIIDNIVFQLNSLPSKKTRENMIQELIKTYSDQYVRKNELDRLRLQIVGNKNFLLVKATYQNTFNYGFYLLQQIYSNPENVRHFWGIDFPRLKVLNLSRLDLNSIEGITFMNIPNLVCLQLHTNYITSIDCLAKVSMLNLKTITLYHNRITVGENLIRAHAPKLAELEFDKYQTRKRYQKIQCIDFIFKIQNPHMISKIFAQHKDRIGNDKKKQKIKKLSMNYARIQLTPYHLTSRRFDY